MDAVTEIILLVGFGLLLMIAVGLGFLSDPFNRCKMERTLLKKRRMVVLVSGKGAGEVLSFIVDMPVGDKAIQLIIGKDQEPLSFVPTPDFVKVYKGVPFVVVDSEDCKPIPLETPFGAKWVQYAQPSWVSRLISPVRLDAFLANSYSLHKAKARQIFEKEGISKWLPYLQLIATVAVVIFLVLAWTSTTQTQVQVSTMADQVNQIAQHIGVNLTKSGIANS